MILINRRNIFYFIRAVYVYVSIDTTFSPILDFARISLTGSMHQWYIVENMTLLIDKIMFDKARSFEHLGTSVCV